jgi:hypothetical protein
MTELKTKEGELTDADLAAYGIPPKQSDGVEAEIKEQAGKITNDSAVEVSREAARKAKV